MRCLGMLLVLASTLPAAVRGDSLYAPGTFRPLTVDRKAFGAGDVITVQVFETSSASTSTDTSTQRENGMSAGMGSSAISGGRPVSGSLAIGGTFDGGGTTQRANRLLTTLTVTVREVLPNGDLRLEGEQRVKVNEEEHIVRLAGRVRPEDVSAENVVISTRLADGRIEYVGDGDLASRGKKAWWRRILDWVGL